MTLLAEQIYNICLIIMLFKTKYILKGKSSFAPFTEYDLINGLDNCCRKGIQK